MSCRYCFQRNGVRSAKKVHASGAVANKQTIDRFAAFCKKNGIERVEFFGGEPLLYKDTFLYAARTLLDTVPGLKLGIVTNGTLIDEEIMRFFEQENVSVLLSLDGKRSRHNLMRGGFDRISHWFDRLVAKGQTTVAMQVSVTKGLFQHVRFIWKLGFPSVYLNVIQNYGWYQSVDIDRFESEYDAALQAMLAGEGKLVCAIAMHRTLEASQYEVKCGITQTGLACDWQGLLYPCHRTPELGTSFTFGDVRNGVSKRKERLCRARINRQCFKSASASEYPLVSFCPITVYQRNGNFSGSWSPMFCELINRKAKVVAKYHYEINKYCLTNLSAVENENANVDTTHLDHGVIGNCTDRQ